MTNDEILQAAKDSYLDQLHLKRDGEKHYILDLGYPEIERFATIIEKRTIERCAEYVNEVCTYGDTHLLVKAIRKLGEQE